MTNETTPESSITERKVVQKNLAGKDAIEKAEDTRRFRVYSVPGYTLRLGENAVVDLPLRRDGLLEREDKSGKKVYTRKQVNAWTNTYILNRVKAKPFEEPDVKDLTDFAKALRPYLFDNDDLPTDIKETLISVEYIEFRGLKFKIRVKKNLWENKQAQWIAWFNKESKRSPGKWRKKADDEIRKFIGKKMKLLPSVMASEGEQQGYVDAFVRCFYDICGTDIPKEQTRLEPVG